MKFATTDIQPTESDAIPSPGILSNLVGWSDLTRSYGIRRRICGPGLSQVVFGEIVGGMNVVKIIEWYGILFDTNVIFIKTYFVYIKCRVTIEYQLDIVIWFERRCNTLLRRKNNYLYKEDKKEANQEKVEKLLLLGFEQKFKKRHMTKDLGSTNNKNS